MEKVDLKYIESIGNEKYINTLYIQNYRELIIKVMSLMNSLNGKSESVFLNYEYMMYNSLRIPSSYNLENNTISVKNNHFKNEFIRYMNYKNLSIIDYNMERFISYIKIYSDIQNYIIKFLDNNAYNIISKNNTDELLDEIIKMNKINKDIYGNNIRDIVNNNIKISSTPIIDLIESKTIDFSVFSNEYYSTLEELLVKLYMVYILQLKSISIYIDKNLEYITKNYINLQIFSYETLLKLDKNNTDGLDTDIYKCFLYDAKNEDYIPKSSIEIFISIWNKYGDKFIKILSTTLYNI